MRKICATLLATIRPGSLLNVRYRHLFFHRRERNDRAREVPTWRPLWFSARLRLAVLPIALSLVLMPAAADAAEQMFGRMFPELPAYDAPSDAALTTLTAAGTTASPGPLFDTNVTASTTPPTFPNDDNPNNVSSFFTYFGQFLDHDMTLDLLPLPSSFVDPTTIPNFRDPRLNLDSVYGGGPDVNPELYEADGKHLKVNDRDLPRNPNGSAILAEGRNDENQVIAQLHVAFLRAHNRLIDEGYGFGNARQLMKWRYQWIVVHEFLPEILDTTVYADVFRLDGSIQTRYYDPKHAAKATMPVEFSVAAYRFGHSQVRRAYIITEGGPKIQVFNTTATDLRGGRPITPDRTIFWPNFLSVDGQPSTGQPGTFQPVANVSRKLDTLLSSGLFTLPIPGAASSGSSILAKRNIQRARQYGLPSGQAVASRLGILPLTNAQIAAAIPRLGVLTTDDYRASLANQPETPLWLYILAESQIVHNGARLGPVGSRIVAEVIGGLLAADQKSYYRKGWLPEGGSFRAQDLLSEAGVL